ncbi:hypothetical protein [Methylibium petroleiphilum]|uniref:Uncharacterized protein n=1 Tax=Methylibium petroleiphilum (strain ATCC BAA-1232 / LMG 22953 / PM1) TaxID=420662 RepID=A2SN40_METPP|nr:hypothetical protein [Methylibium petroleiphilum]ABM96979.1 hypothetical protein Mpe_B0204 [Methylibium petroleiphilum PM1]
MSRLTVIIWDNAGVRRTEPAADRKEALAKAAAARNLSNRTVKLADSGGSTDHWSRSTHLARNHWCCRAVADEYFL